MRTPSFQFILLSPSPFPVIPLHLFLFSAAAAVISLIEFRAKAIRSPYFSHSAIFGGLEVREASRPSEAQL